MLLLIRINERERNETIDWEEFEEIQEGGEWKAVTSEVVISLGGFFNDETD